MFQLAKDANSIIKVIGVGGGGTNAVNYMFRQGIVGVDFAVCNTDEQSLRNSPVPRRIALGPSLTEGRGAGSNPPVGKQAAIESIDEIRAYLEGAKMLFITAGMGGGTGTGAAPIIAKLAHEMGILTVGIVTLPFTYEGKKRVNQGFEGLAELKQYTDAYVVISNDKLRTIYGSLALSQAFSQADLVLTTAAKGIAEIITRPGIVNVDFEDVNTVMRGSGMAVMGIGVAEGENRARRAADEALNSPLLEENNIAGAQQILINITSGTKEATMDEVFEITQFVQDEAGGADLIWGHCHDDNMGDKLSVTVIATGFTHEFESPYAQSSTTKKRDAGNYVSLDQHLRDETARTIEFNDPTPNRPLRQSDHQAERRVGTSRAERSPTSNRPMAELTLQELEAVPAYLRRNRTFTDPTLNNPQMSNLSLDTDDSVVQRRNSYLNPDLD